jgi:F1F0 ATPase subunit 2
VISWPAALFALLVGAILGLGYFGGLWLTVHWVAHRGGSATLLLGSFVARTILALGGFLLLLRWTARWELLALALLGFVALRTLLLRRWGLKPSSGSVPSRHGN